MIEHRDLLRRAGAALYGEQWQSPLARDLGVADRTMRRWIAEPYDISPGVWRDLDRLLLQRVVDIEKLRNEMIRASLTAD